MDWRNDLNISGNRVVNVADPIKNDHVATKHYVDHLHIILPNENAHEYVRYINARNQTIHSITGQCTISWNFDWDVGDAPEILKQATGPHVLLESVTAPTILHVTAPQHLENKTITVNYKFPVSVRSWSLFLYIKGKKFDPNFKFKYCWEVSRDNKKWGMITLPVEVVINKSVWCGNDGYIWFENGNNGVRSFHWRIRITEGELTQAMYVNQLYMSVA